MPSFDDDFSSDSTIVIIYARVCRNIIRGVATSMSILAQSKHNLITLVYDI